MNIAAQICGLSILGMLIFFYLSQQKVDFKNSRIFIISVFADVVCLLLDIISIWAIRATPSAWSDRTLSIFSESPVVMEYITPIICKLYLISLVVISYFGFVYAVSLMPIIEKNSRRIDNVAISICAIACTLISVVKVEYKADRLSTYSYGPACALTYIFASAFMIMTFAIPLIYHKSLVKGVFPTIAFWIAFEVVCTVIQLCFPQLLLVGFASAMGLAVAYLELENPGLQIDKISGLFNMTTLQMYLNNFYRKDLPFSYIIIRLVYDIASPPDRNGSDMRIVASLLKKTKQAKVFYIGQSEFMLIFRDSEIAKKKASSINSIMDTLYKNNGKSFIEILETDGRRASSISEIMEMTGQISSNTKYSDISIYRITDDDYTKFRQEKIIAKEIDDALAEDRVEAFFQPIYSIDEDAFSGAEALVRIRRKDGSIMPPVMFIPVAEKTGQVTKIGDRIFEKTLDILKNGGIRNLGVKFMDVNLSVLQCDDNTLAVRYINAIHKADIPPQMLCFEITETAMIENRKNLLYNLNLFKEAGCSCSLDDFGNGESNLNYVIDMPIDFIKADRSMVIEYTSSNRVSLIMDLMVRMAKGLSLKIVAEGVEADKDLNAMKNLKIDYIQGYYFSRPLSRDDYISFLQKNNRQKQEQ